MVIGKSPFSPRGGERRARRRALRVAILAALLGFGACSPVDTWRDLTGANRNDPDPNTTPNTQNLAAGEAADYPNLATVPPPPTRAMTAAERDKLTQSLISDRANARYTAEQLRAGFPGLAAAPPPPPGSATETENVRSAPTLTGPTPAATPPSAPGLPVEAPAPAKAAALAAPAAGRATTSRAAAAAAALVAPTAEPFPTLAPAVEPLNQTKAGGTKSAGPGQGLRKQGEPPEPGPMESSLEIPQARATPQPEQIQSAPPTPQLPPTPTVAARPLSGGLAAGGALAPMSSPVTPGSAGFQPPPAPPELPPPPPTRSAAADPGKAAAKPAAPVDSPVAEIKFGADATALTDGDKKTLETVVPLFREKPGKVRIVGYAGAGGGAVEQLNSYRTALDRAHLVATALTQAGIPADKIQVEAAPAGANSGESRAEVLLER
jgi:outer membrane protein OmpA-like peptidoglycan-associated protein